jgi:hypothetical protein
MFELKGEKKRGLLQNENFQLITAYYLSTSQQSCTDQNFSAQENLDYYAPLLSNETIFSCAGLLESGPNPSQSNHRKNLGLGLTTPPNNLCEPDIERVSGLPQLSEVTVFHVFMRFSFKNLIVHFSEVTSK